MTKKLLFNNSKGEIVEEEWVQMEVKTGASSGEFITVDILWDNDFNFAEGETIAEYKYKYAANSSKVEYSYKIDPASASNRSVSISRSSSKGTEARIKLVAAGSSTNVFFRLEKDTTWVSVGTFTAEFCKTQQIFYAANVFKLKKERK